MREEVVQLWGEMQLLIQGTKNAYTTIRKNDLVVYELLDPESDDAPYGIGLYTGDGQLFPMCCRDKFRNELYVDHIRPAESSEQLKEQGRLLRMVSSDRVSAKQCFTISEWIDSTYSVPIVQPDELSHEEVVAIRALSKVDTHDAVPAVQAVQADQAETSTVIEARLKVARLELELALTHAREQQ